MKVTSDNDEAVEDDSDDSDDDDLPAVFPSNLFYVEFRYLIVIWKHSFL